MERGRRQRVERLVRSRRDRQTGFAPPERADGGDGDLLQLLPHLERALKAIGGVLAEQPLDDRRKPRIELRLRVAHGRDGIVDLAQHDRHRRLGVGVRDLADEHLVDDDPEGVEIRPRPDGAPHRLLGRHVGGRPDRRTGRGQEAARRSAVDRLRNPEVRDLHPTLVRDHHVLGLEVAVDDAACLGVRKARQQSLEDADHLRKRQPGDHRPQRSALQVLHRDEGRPLVLEVVVHRHDVRMAERAGDVRLANEPLGECGIGGVERGELLQRHVAVEVGLPGEIDDGHPAATNLSQHLVASDGALYPLS